MSPARILAVFLLLLAAAPALAQPKWKIERAYQSNVDICPCCRMSCVKPWVVPDRWDDATPIPGHPEWANNGRHDHEPYSDLNGNRLYDPGESFTDQNGDGVYNEEFYHPFLTGYVAWKDVGSPIVLKPGSGDGTFAAGHYNAVDFSDEERLDPTGNRYEWDISECATPELGPGDILRYHSGDRSGPTRRGVEALIAKDPDAYWDPATQQIVSYNPLNPRTAFIAFADPRVDIPSGRETTVIAKIAAVFIQGIEADGTVSGRFLRAGSHLGTLCPPGYPTEAAFISACRE